MQLFDATPSEVDVETLMHQLRAECGGGSQSCERLFGVGAGAGRSAMRDAVLTQLSEVERNAAVGTNVPRFERFGPAKRKAARLAARVVLYLSRIVTVPQRSVNFGLLQALRSTLACLKDEEAARLELQARVQLLDRSLAALRVQFEQSAMREMEHQPGQNHSARQRFVPRR